MSLFSLFFGFKGRINRAQFWFGNSVAGFSALMLLFVLGAMFFPTTEIPKTGAGMLHAMSVIGLILLPPLALIGWVGFALQTKRLHDHGRSATWTMLPLLPGFMITSTIFASIAAGQTPEQAAVGVGAWMLVANAINLVMFIYLGCMPGKKEDNKYGPPPSGGYSGGASTSAPIPGQSSASKAPVAVPGMGMTSAESAIERAIAAREKQAQAPVSQAPARAFAASQPSAAPMRPANGASSFGRKAAS